MTLLLTDSSLAAPVASFNWSWPSATTAQVTDLMVADEMFDPQFSWAAVPGATKYEVEVNSSVDFAPGSKVCCSQLTISTSMAPTLTIGDHVFIDKLTVRFHSPERGEVIIFRMPCTPSRMYLKRVIALAGQTVEVRCDVVYVDGVALAQTEVSGPCSYDDHDEMNGRWFEKSCSAYMETLGGRTYRTFQDAERRPGRDDGGRQDFPNVENPVPPSCASVPEESSGATKSVVGGGAAPGGLQSPIPNGGEDPGARGAAGRGGGSVGERLEQLGRCRWQTAR